MELPMSVPCSGRDVVLLHIPRTGGTARRISLHGQQDKVWVPIPEHDTRYSEVYDLDATIIVYVRHPVARFVSAWRRHPDPRWPHPDDLALSGPKCLYGLTSPDYREAMWWVDAEINERNTYLFATESMSWTWPRLMATLGVDAAPLRPPQPILTRVPALSEAAREAVEDWYSDDLSLWNRAIHRRAGLGEASVTSD